MKTLSSSVAFQDEAGNALANGSLVLTLPYGVYEIAAGGGQVVGQSLIVNLDASGKITGTPQIWASDELIPQTPYSVSICSGQKGLGEIASATWLIAGASPIDLSQMVSTSAGASFPAPVLQNPTGDQVIQAHDLLPGTSGAQGLGNASKLWNAFLATMQAVTGTITSLTVTTLNKLTFTQPATGATLTVPDGTTQTFPSTSQTLVGQTSTDTLKNKAMTGTGSGNSVTLLNSQDTLGNITGNGTDQTLYAFTIPPNTVQAGKGVRLKCDILSNNAVTVTYKLTLGSTTVATIANSSGVETDSFMIDIDNNAGVQNAQVWTFNAFGGTAIISNNSVTSAENFANALTLKITASEAATNTVTPKKWKLELIQ